ncbi:MAG TPA: SufS family cysteine desulfurase [Nitriliruptorales bacterium]|nr:SufS family cysteine desulfurase [Nitriliruptorales bacterium]
MRLDVQTIKKDFPTLRREVHGRRLVFVDSAASSQTPQPVLDAMADYYEQRRCNVERGVYLIATEATEAYETARRKVAAFVDAPVEGTVFTRNTTEAINLVAYSWVRRRLGEGDALLATEMEHHANLVPWLEAAKERGFELRFVPITDDGRLDLDAVPQLLADGRVRFLAVTHQSNVLSTINPVSELVRQVRAANPDCKVLVDGAQSVPHMPVSFRALDVDFLAFSGHKMLGPTGIGVLVARPELLDAMPPFITGGSMILDVTLEGARWNELPHKFEAGTMPIAEAIGLGAAVDYLEGLGMESVRAHEVELTAAVLAALDTVEGVTVHGPRDVRQRGGAVSFLVDGVHAHDVGTVLDHEGVAVRVGHHCAKPLMRRLGVAATARASFYVYNDEDDIDALVHGIRAAQAFFAAVPERLEPVTTERDPETVGGPA